MDLDTDMAPADREWVALMDREWEAPADRGWVALMGREWEDPTDPEWAARTDRWEEAPGDRLRRREEAAVGAV